jgi:hypothetical protein
MDEGAGLIQWLKTEIDLISEQNIPVEFFIVDIHPRLSKQMTAVHDVSTITFVNEYETLIFIE